MENNFLHMNLDVFPFPEFHSNISFLYNIPLPLPYYSVHSIFSTSIMNLLALALVMGIFFTSVFGPKVEINISSVKECAPLNLDWLNDLINRSECKGSRVLLCYQSGLDPQIDDRHYKPSRRFQLARNRTTLAQCCECMQSKTHLQGSCKRASKVSDARWHTLKLDQEMNQEDKFKEYKSAIISGAFLDDYFGLWALKMDISGKNDGMVWAKCGNGTNKTTNSSKLSTITTISALDTKSSELTTPGSKVKPVRCWNGSHSSSWGLSPPNETTFVETECGPNHSRCFEAGCAISDEEWWIKGCALPGPGNTTCEQVGRKECFEKKYFRCQNCDGNLCNNLIELLIDH